MRFRSRPRHIARELRESPYAPLTYPLPVQIWRPVPVIFRSVRPGQAWPGLPLRRIEDRRLFHPESFYRPARTLSGNRPRIVAGSSHSLFSMPHGVRFDVPAKTVICVRRKRRKEVLFAKGKAGAGRKRPPRRNWYSNVRC